MNYIANAGCPWAEPSLQKHPGPQLARYLSALCYRVPKQGHGAPDTPTHPAAEGAEASDCPVQTRQTLT